MRRALLLCGALFVAVALGIALAPPADGPVVPPELRAALAVANEITRKIETLNPQLPASQTARIREAILRSSARHGLDPLLVTAVIEVESAFRPGARSNLGALGLMQVMPHMFRTMNFAGNPATIEANVEAGCTILADNIRRLGEHAGISAYFWGSEIRGTSYLERVQMARSRMVGAQRGYLLDPSASRSSPDG